jgi:3-deoxy-D-manno-octulosonic-acid transferase
VVGVLMETETWPVLLHEAKALGLPMLLANARLSARSLGKGQALASLMRPALASFTAVLAQTDADAARFREAGALTVEVMGNVKFDITPDTTLLAQGRRWREQLARPVVLAAVTREGEEAPLLAAWAQRPMPRPLLLVVPRHPQRFDEVAGLVQGAGLTLQRRSHIADQPGQDEATADVWLGDTMREMALYYGLADCALLGGSFAPLGGQNLIEAAACGCPLLMGPHTFNFAQAAEMAIAAGAARRVPNLLEAVVQAVALASASERQAMASRAEVFAAAHRGAAQRMAAAVLRVAAHAPSETRSAKAPR